MMANGIKTSDGYRFYGFNNLPPIGIYSVFSVDGRNWFLEQGYRLKYDPGNALESQYVKDPAVVYKDGQYIMYYVTRKSISANKQENSDDYSGASFYLFQNYPNPFNPSTDIRFRVISISGRFVTLKIFDIYGKEIAVLVNGKLGQGEYSVNFNANGLPGGVYFYVLQAGKYKKASRMVYLR